jgi:dipeptidyl aminopeptidase/acylaminoacyl peptidase
MKKIIRLTGFLITAASVVALLPAGAQTAATPPAAASASKPDIETIFKRPQFGTFLISPDGKKLATLAPMNGRDNLVVLDLEKRSRTNITNFDSYDAAEFNWITNDRLYFRTISARDVTGRVIYQGTYAINIDGSGIKNLDSMRGTPAGSRLIRVTDRKSGDMIIEANLRRREAVDLYLVNTTTNKMELLTFDSPANTSSFLLDSNNVPRFAWAGSDPKRSLTEELWYRADAKTPWEKIQTWEESARHWSPIRFNADDKTVLVLSNIDRDTKAIYEYDLQSRKLGKLVFEHPNEDLDATSVLTLADPNEPSQPAKLVGFESNFDIVKREWTDPTIDDIQKQIDKALPGRINRFSPVAVLGKPVVVSSFDPNSPPKHFLYNPTSKNLEELPSMRPWLDKIAMPKRSFVHYAARDGLKIPGFLTLPVGAEGKKVPLIVNIHGGPEARSYNGLSWGRGQYDMEARFFATRGWAVLEPEPRGSLDFGFKHLTAGWGQWGRSMQDDITDGVKYLIEKGIVDPNKVCLFGGSYGGYATLQGMVREPDMFKCGLSTVAVTDLTLFQETTWSDIPVQYDSTAKWFAKRVGDVDKDKERLAQNSPARNAGKIKGEVLLVMGEADVRVPQIHGTKMRDAMKAAGVKHEYHVYVGEGHGWNKEANIFDFYRRAETFFAKHLGQ